MPSVQLAVPQRVRVPTGPRPWAVARVWRVVHVGQSAIILSAAPGGAERLMAVTSRRRGLVAGGICLPDDDAYDALARRLAAPTPSAPPDVDLGAWSTVPPAEITTVDLHMTATAVRREAVELLAALLETENRAAPAGAAMDPRPARALAEPLTLAALTGDEARVAHLLSRLVGVGPGATPAGDDVIVGVLAALDAAAGSLRDEASARAARAVLGTRLRPLLGRTTAIGRHDLTAALAGRFAEHVHRLVSALADPAAVPAAVATARSWGATSGVDLATGMASALARLLRRPDAPSNPRPRTQEERMSSPDTETLQATVFPRLYRDSVALMALASSIEKREGVLRAGAVMATPGNLEILGRSEMLPLDLTAAPDDLVLVVRAQDEQTANEALEAATAGLTATEQSGGAPREEVAPQTMREGLAAAADATLVTVSTPGPYAPAVAEQALRRGLHVFCFSDNVPLADEVRLKRLAVDRQLLLMGPDCGTAILDGVPLGFANVVRPGPVAIVAASGTGAQEVSCLLDDAGTGISQLIGVGGRDLSAEVGGLMTELALDLVAADDASEIVVLVSKPPAPEVADRLLARLAGLGKPVVACLLGAEDADGPVVVRGTLEGGAAAAAALAGTPLALQDPGTEPADAAPLPGRILGLYTGGTLASETKVVLGRACLSAEVLDLGDDEYTAGRPHPMIDPSARADRVARAGADPDVALVLVDLVLGHGASPDPATPLAEAVREARASAAADGRELVVAGSVCGTAADPQDIETQRRILQEAGVVLHPSNAAAARYAVARATGSLPTDPTLLHRQETA